MCDWFYKGVLGKGVLSPHLSAAAKGPSWIGLYVFIFTMKIHGFGGLFLIEVFAFCQSDIYIYNIQYLIKIKDNNTTKYKLTY